MAGLLRSSVMPSGTYRVFDLIINSLPLGSDNSCWRAQMPRQAAPVWMRARCQISSSHGQKSPSRAWAAAGRAPGHRLRPARP